MSALAIQNAEDREQKTENITKAMNGLERKYGKIFYSKFKSITFDNGVEFMDYKGMEKSCLRNKKRTSIYYAHPYCSGERGSNENNNRMIRRWIPKGGSIDEISKEFGISGQSLFRIETCNTVPSIDLIVKFANKYKVKLDYLITGKVYYD